MARSTSLRRVSLTTAILQRYGLNVIRFTNQQIDQRFLSVCASIDTAVHQLLDVKPSQRNESHVSGNTITMNKYTIKRMETEAEFSGKVQVHVQSWHETYTGLIDAAYLQNQATPERFARLARQRADNVLIAKDGDRVIGFAACGPYRGDDLTEHGEIYSIYVLRAYHGQKVGYALMNAAFKQLAAYKRIALWVLKSNAHAISFYSKYGFRPDGVQAEIPLGTPNTELRMIYEAK